MDPDIVYRYWYTLTHATQYRIGPLLVSLLWICASPMLSPLHINYKNSLIKII